MPAAPVHMLSTVSTNNKGAGMRKRLTYANVVATLALVFAMTGGALAASHYLINSTRQINPRVLRALHGKQGPRGRTGPSHAYSAVNAAGEPFAKVFVPAGRYEVRGVALFENRYGKPTAGVCELHAEPKSGLKLLDYNATSVPDEGNEEEFFGTKKLWGEATVTDQATVYLKTSAYVVETCSGSRDSEVGVEIARVTVIATAVGGIN